LTLVGIKKLSVSLSQSQISRNLKKPGFKRKSLLHLCPEENSKKRIDFCSGVMGMLIENFSF
jgi:hypothetical protein